MLCNLQEYPNLGSGVTDENVRGSESVRGAIDGGRLTNVFEVEIENGEVFYKVGCEGNGRRRLTAKTYPASYLTLLTGLYNKYIRLGDDLDITYKYEAMPFTSYPRFTDIECEYPTLDETSAV